MSGIGYDRYHAERDAEFRRNGIPARFPGWCMRCDKQWQSSDPIVRVTGGRWVHVDCANGGDDE